MKCRLFLTNFNEIRIFSTDFRKQLKDKVSSKSVQWEPSCSMRTDKLTDGRRDIMKLIVAFRSLRARLKIQLDHPFVMSSRLCERTHTHTDKYAILIAFHGNSGFVNAPQCYVIRTLHLVRYSNSDAHLACLQRAEVEGVGDKNPPKCYARTASHNSCYLCNPSNSSC